MMTAISPSFSIVTLTGVSSDMGDSFNLEPVRAWRTERGFANSIVDGGVDKRLDLAPHGIGGGGHELGHKDHANLFDRIDEETGRKHAAPVKIAGRSGNARARRIERDREAEPEPDPGIFILAANAAEIGSDAWRETVWTDV